MLTSFLRDRRGNFSVLTAVMLTSLVGAAGLVADYGNGLFNRIEDQRVADAAAIAGATIYSETASGTSMGAAVTNVASYNGVTSGSVVSSLVNSPTGDGNKAVEVTVSSTAPLTFARLLQPGKTQIAIQAVSYAEMKPGGQGCIIALKSGGSGVTASGGTSVTAQNCSVASNQTITCSGGATITVGTVYYYSAVPSCSGLKTSTGGTPTETQTYTPDPLMGTSEVLGQTSRLAAVETLASPSGPVAGTGTSLSFSSSGSATIAAAAAGQGCTAALLSSVWTVTCPSNATLDFGTISVSGSVTVNFNLNGSGDTYNITQISTGSGKLNFGPGTYNVAKGVVTTNGSAVTTFAAGTFNIGASSSVSCNSSNTYSICNTGPTMTFAGPSTFVLQGGIYTKGSTTLTLGSGSTNSYNIGKAADGNSLYVSGSAIVSFGDATGTGDLFQMAGNMNDPNGGTCLKVGAATNHDINGYFLTAGGNILGSGVYTVADYVSLGGSNGGNVTCWGTSTGVSASGVTLVIGGDKLDASGHAFYVGAGYSSVTLSAPTSGSTQNIAVIGPTSSTDTGSAVFTEGSTNTVIQGAFYMPYGNLSMSGAASVGNGSGQCLELIASQVTLSGGSALASSCSIPGVGLSGSGVVSLVQ
ncbi:MAG: pilus assembly protein TadG-related protein [Rhizomicrobium sp.]